VDEAGGDHQQDGRDEQQRHRELDPRRSARGLLVQS